MSRAGWALALPAALALLLASGATAATRYAAPGGTGKDPCTNPSRPCSVYTAADAGAPRTTIAAGDVIELAPGTYYAREEGEFGYVPPVHLPEGVTLRGEPGKPRPVVVMPADSFADSAFYVPAGAEVADVEIRNLMDTAGAISISGGTINGVIARSTITIEPTCYFHEGTVRNSACIGSGGGPAIGTNTATKGTLSGVIRNSTLVATGPGSVGMEFIFSAFKRGLTVNIDVAGTLIAGEAKDVIAKGWPLNKGRGARVDIDLRSSSYATVEFEARAGGRASVTAPGTNANIKAIPLLARDNLHQLTDSPTVDRGAVDDASGGLDVDEQPRTMGVATDIGADEFDPFAAPGANLAPVTKLVLPPLPRPSLTGFRRTNFAFGSSDIGSRFECKLDRRPYRACASPHRRKVGLGKHVFRVRAIDPQGLADPTPATFHWRVLSRPAFLP
ncbi:MAG TPA: hypothetical protein VN752_05400 [Solirubrobacterales bacterium]|nr:hypothetical protein [Solirubrobacterales bacterium]